MIFPQMYHNLAQTPYIFAPETRTKTVSGAFLIFKKEVYMWFAVIVFVCLATEVLSYLSGGEISLNTKNER